MRALAGCVDVMAGTLLAIVLLLIVFVMREEA